MPRHKYRDDYPDVQVCVDCMTRKVRVHKRGPGGSVIETVYQPGWLKAGTRASIEPDCRPEEAKRNQGRTGFGMGDG